MSTPTQPRPDTSAGAPIPRPRTAAEPAAGPAERPVEPSVEAHAETSAGSSPVTDQPAQRAGLFERHAWLIPACAIASVIAAFTAMIVLTWLAGGRIPFER